MATKKLKIPQARPLGYKESTGKNLVLYYDPEDEMLKGFDHDAKLLEDVIWSVGRKHGRFFIETAWGFNHENGIVKTALPLIRKESKAAGIKLSVRNMTKKSSEHYREQRHECWKYINKKI